MTPGKPGIGALVALLVTPAALAAQSAAPDSLPPGVSAQMIEAGRRIFAGPGVCFACHGQDAGGGMAPSLRDTVWIHSRGEYDCIVATILNGVPARESKSHIIMPPRGGSAISDAEVRAVAAYVWSLSRVRQSGAK